MSRMGPIESGDGDDARRELAESWIAAIGRDEIVAELERVYAAAGAAIAARGPACWASGRCCNFDEAGHRLYVTGIEAIYCLVRAVSSPWGKATGRVQKGGVAAEITVGGRAIALEPAPSGGGLLADVAAATARGGCPFQVGNLCGVHEFKPLGCRVYFCDKSAQEWQMELSEKLLGEIRAMHDRWGIEYRYGEWREMLGMFRA